MGDDGAAVSASVSSEVAGGGLAALFMEMSSGGAALDGSSSLEGERNHEKEV